MTTPSIRSDQKRPRNLGRVAIAALVAGLLAGGGYVVWKKYFAVQSPRELYQIVSVTRGNMEDLVSAIGTLQPREFVDVGAQVSGQLKKIHIEVGSNVTEKDLLAEIDPTVFLANVDARRAGLRNLKATMLDRESQLVLAQLQFDRQQSLKAEGATSTEVFQQAEATLRSAKAQIAALQAQIEQTESTLRADEANLNYAKIYAPMTGTVVSVTARQGQTLNSNQSAPIILRIADLSTMTVQTQVSEADVNKLRNNMEVYFTTLGSGGRRWWGKLRKIEPTPTVTNNVVLYNALFDVPNANQALMTSMTAQVFFVVNSVQDTLLLPVAAVQQGNRAGRPQGAPGARSGAVPDAAGSNAGAAGGAGVPATAIAAPPAATAAPATGSAVPGAAPATAGTPEGTRPRREHRDAAASGSGAGREGASRDGAVVPRRATVKVIDAHGNIAERQVELGASNRVQVQVLSGLEEGEQVIAGVKQAPVSTAPVRPATGGLGAAPAGAGRGR